MQDKQSMFKNKKVVIGIVVATLLLGIGGYFIYDNHCKTEIINKMEITFTDVKEVEYGTKDFDVKKELIKEVKEAKLTKTPKLDTSKVGEVTLKFYLKKSDVIKEIEHKINIVDTKAPEITLETDSKELTVGDEYDIKSNIKSVKDVVDGDISINDKALEINKKATEEYLKLKREDITNEIKVADKKVTDFLVETIKNEESGKETINLYLKNCYYIDGTVDTTKAEDYKINIVSVDKNGIKATKEFAVTVKEKEVEKPFASGGSSSNGEASSSGGGSVRRGSKQDIINTALAQVDKPYRLYANGPDAFDCEGLIYYAYTQNGWNIPQHVSSGGTRVGLDQIQPGDIIYLPTLKHIILYIGNEKVVEALNPQQGIRVGNMFLAMCQQPDVQFIRY